MLERMAKIAALRANPVNAFAAGIGLRFGLVERLLAGGVNLLNTARFFLGLLLRQFPVPPHLLRNLGLGLVGVAIFVKQFHVFVRARVAFLEKLLVIVLVPGLLGSLLSALLLLDGLGEQVHELIHARGGLFGPLRLVLRGHPPFRRGNRDFVIG